MQRILSFVIGFLLVASVSAAYAANDTLHARQFISNIGQKVIYSLKYEEASKQEREQLLEGILTENFDVKSIGHFVLGRYVRTASESQINEFIGVFQDYIMALYTKQFNHYSGEEFIVKRGFVDGRTKQLLVFAEIRSQNKEPINLSFQLIKKNGNFKIVDVKIQGISMLVTLRSDFTGFLNTNNGNVDNLIDALKIKIKHLAAGLRDQP